jgi:uncharacterized OB-fold protein
MIAMRTQPEMPAHMSTPHPSATTQPFFDAAREHRLVCMRCDDCGTFRLPPTRHCYVCRSQAVTWEELAGTGEVYTFTVARHAFTPYLADAVPYVIAVIKLDGAGDARLVSNVVDTDPAAVHVGAKVRVVFDDVSDDVSIPRFVLC